MIYPNALQVQRSAYECRIGKHLALVPRAKIYQLDAVRTTVIGWHYIMQCMPWAWPWSRRNRIQLHDSKEKCSLTLFLERHLILTITYTTINSYQRRVYYVLINHVSVWWAMRRTVTTFRKNLKPRHMHSGWYDCYGIWQAPPESALPISAWRHATPTAF